VTEAWIIGRYEMIFIGEKRQQRLPHPRRGRKAVKQEHGWRIGRPRLAVKDREALDIDGMISNRPPARSQILIRCLEGHSSNSLTYGFGAIPSATAVAPLVTVLLVARLPTVAPVHHARFSFAKVFRAVWLPGFGSALGSVGFGAVTTFVALLFANRGWANGWLAYTAYAIAFILACVFFSHLADAIGGAEVALVCALVEAVGQALIWLADRPGMALLGAALTGFGFSLVYPGFGVEAVRRVSAQSRGLAMGAYTAFPDLAEGVASPALGLIACGAGLNSAFLASAVTVLCAAVVASWLMTHPANVDGRPQ
jgi:predicted MFS family arabinose efflux permease